MEYLTNGVVGILLHVLHTTIPNKEFRFKMTVNL